MHSPSYDILVIGAGAAGLAATAELLRNGQRVLLLEARDRIGGRLWTRQEPGLAAPIELGAEFIHGHAAITRTLLAGMGAPVIESQDGHCTLKDGLPSGPGTSFDRIQQVVRDGASLLEREDLSFETFLERLGDALTPAERDSARMFAEGFDAADASRASARALLAEWRGDTLGDVPQSRPEGGYAALLAALAAALDPRQLRLMLGAQVQEVRWSRGAVTVTGMRYEAPFTAHAPRLLIAVPLGVLQAPPGSAGAINFAPALEAKRAALAGLASGPVIKIMLRFTEAFWEDLHGGAYRDASFFHVADAPVRTFWTQAPIHAPLMVSWAAGPRAERLAGAGSEGAMVQCAVQSLEKLFGSSVDLAGQLQGYYTHNWQQDPYARGAYSYVLVGGSGARAQLAEPLERTLFFAGEATDNADEAGTVTGALESGVRAAREIIGS